MSVYVDDPIYPLGHMMMCHMLADTPGEMHAMAELIGVERPWFHSHGTAPHYDICENKRAIAIANGAIEVDRRTLGELIKRIRANPWR